MVSSGRIAALIVSTLLAAATALAGIAAGCGEGEATPSHTTTAVSEASVDSSGSAAPEAGAGETPIDAELPVYKPVPGVSGSLRAAGSDTMLNLATQWAAGFARRHPSVQPQVEGKGSSTAPPALLENQAQFGPMSRAMDDEEVDLFRDRFGYPPTELRSAIDCVAIFVHRDNPIESVTLAQLEAAFGVGGNVATWADLGVTDPAWQDRPISLYGRNSASGTYKFFKDHALAGTDFRPTVKEQPGSSGVVRAIATDRFGLGYSGIGYTSPAVRAVPVAFDETEPATEPTPEHANSGAYPLARFLYVYLNHDASQTLDPLREGFVRFIFSREGQEEVVKDGAYPISAAIAREELAKLGLEPGF